MTMWLVIMLTFMGLTALALIYLCGRLAGLSFVGKIARGGRLRGWFFSAGIVLASFGIAAACLNLVNAVVCALYFAMTWLAIDVLSRLCRLFFHKAFSSDIIGGIAIVSALLLLWIGWYLDHHVSKTVYTLTTAKKVPDMRIVMFADAHVGTTFNAAGFADRISDMRAEDPDIVFVVGDFVDDDTSKEDMVAACAALGTLKTKYGVYFVLGNHDKGYYASARRGFSENDLIAELEKNKIAVLRDNTVLIDDAFYVVGRRDLSEVKERTGHRQSMAELVKGLDSDRYIIALDHQPADYAAQAKSGADLILSGHTHGGQLLPFNRVGKWIGANDMVYGHEKRGNTDFIVTSGISDWAIKFKTGTGSEFVVIDVAAKKD